MRYNSKHQSAVKRYEITIPVTRSSLRLAWLRLELQGASGSEATRCQKCKHDVSKHDVSKHDRGCVLIEGSCSCVNPG